MRRAAAQGVAVDRIAEALQTSTSTVKRDLKVIVQENVQHVHGLDAARLAADVWSQWEQVRAQLWDVVRRASHGLVRLSALTAIGRELERVVALLQRLGMITTLPQTVVVEIQFLRMLQGMTDAEKLRVGQLDQAAFEAYIAERIGEAPAAVLFGRVAVPVTSQVVGEVES